MGARSPLAPAGTGRRLYSFCLLYVRDLVDVIVTRKHGLRAHANFKCGCCLLPADDGGKESFIFQELRRARAPLFGKSPFTLRIRQTAIQLTTQPAQHPTNSLTLQPNDQISLC